MADPTETKVAFRELLSTFSPVSHRKWEVALKKINVHILEMEDALFHHNSAVMMPENPEGKSSTEGGGADASQAKVSGVKALALVFKQFEFNPKQKIVLAGHTDTSGDAKYNFELSELRAQNVLYLLIGERTEWAKVCHRKQKVEDHQQILKWAFKTRKWPCNPGAVDNSWDADTEKALSNFVQYYNNEFADKKGKPRLADDTVKKVKSDGQKRWPVELWEAAYDLYNDDLCTVLQDSPEQLDKRRKETLYFVDDSKPYVACGESFPIKDKEKSNYRSQANRRVEILFFDADEAPVLNCPKDVSAVHKEKDCPLYHGYHFIPLYIDPSDLYAVMYHLSFRFYDRAANKLRDVPEGLTIVAVENGTEEVPCEREIIAKGDSVVYALKLQFKTPLNDPNRKTLHFEFRTDKQWVFTENAGASPKLVTEDPAKITKLPLETRLKYYDLPAHWSSQNYWTRYDGNMATGDRFEKVLKTDKKLKPFGTNVTAPDKPLLFSLDDIVLTDQSFNQNLKDKDAGGNVIDLDEHSRFALFYVDVATKEDVGGVQKNLQRMTIFKPEASQPNFTETKFTRNLITNTPNHMTVDPPGHVRVIYFCYTFYDITNKRTSDPVDFTAAHQPVLGARLALANDAAVHVGQDFRSDRPSDKASGYCHNNTANYELHYFHDCGVLDGKPLNYVFIHWSCRFKAGAGITANDVKKHRELGIPNATKRLNKSYLFEQRAGGLNLLIRPFHYIEAKENTHGGKQKSMVTVVTTGSWNLIDKSEFRLPTYADEPNRFGNPDPDNNVEDTDGSKYAPLANHHELGHATGNFDDYLGDLTVGGLSYGDLPRYTQNSCAEGGPYSIDMLSRMNRNRTPRIRDFWKYVCWLHDLSKPAGKLHTFFVTPPPTTPPDPRFKITFRAKTFTHNFELPDEFKNSAKPAKSSTDAATPTTTKADLLLYKLGDDETAHLLRPPRIYDAILVVKPKLALAFSGAGWTNDARVTWAQGLNSEILSMLNGNNGKFRLSSAGANPFRNTYVSFIPHYTVEAAGAAPWPPAGSHMGITVRFVLGSTFNHPSDSVIECDWGASAAAVSTQYRKVARFIFGFANNSSNFTKGNFQSIVTWMNSLGLPGGPFTMELMP